MPEYLAPGVFVEEVSYRAKSIEGVSTTTTGFVGATRYGPLDIEPEIITSLVEFERVYGGRQKLKFTDGGTPSDNYTWNAVRAFFEEGGKRLYVARAFNGDAEAACARVVDPLPPLNVAIRARFPGRAGEARVTLQVVASQNRLVFRDGAATLAGVGDRDVVSITNFNTATPPVAQDLPLGPAGRRAGLYVVERDIPNDTWTFDNEDGHAFTLADLDPHTGVRVQVLTASVFVEPQGEGLPFFAAAGLALDRGHRSAGRPDSLFDYFAVEPASMSAARSIPVVIRALTVAEATVERDRAVTAFNAATTADTNAQTALTGATTARTNAQTADTDAQTAITDATADRDAAQADVDNPPPGSDPNDLATALADAQQALDDAIAAKALTATALDAAQQAFDLATAAKAATAAALAQATQVRDAAVAAFNAANANAEPSGLDFLNGFVAPAATANRFTLDHLVLVADPVVTSPVLEARYFMTGGSDGEIPDQGSYQGEEDSTTNRKRGLVALEDIEDISIVATPGSSAGAPQLAQGVVNVLIAHAQRMKYRIAVVDSIKGQSIAETRDFRGKFDSSHAAFYYPWVKIIDPETGVENHYPPSGFVAGIYARNDTNRAVYKAPANEVVNLALGFEKLLNKAQQEVLNPEGINCFRYFEGRGMRLWGARTMSSDPEWKYVNLRRYFAYLERSIDKGTQWAVFEPNGERLWANVKRTIDDFLLNEWQNGALLGDKPEKAYFVKCDRSTMSQNDLDNGRLVCQVGVAALRPAEFVIFRIGQWTADRRS